MTPSKDHERNKSFIGRLLEVYALDRGIDLSPYRQLDAEGRPAAERVEPDEVLPRPCGRSGRRSGSSGRQSPDWRAR